MEAEFADLKVLAESALGGPARVSGPLPGGGSERFLYRFYRRKGSGTDMASVVGVIGRNAAEGRAFVGFTRHFAAQGLPVPRIYRAGKSRAAYVMEDLGDVTLAAQLARLRAGPAGRALALATLSRVVGWLPRFQVHGGQGLDYSLCCESEQLDTPVFEADLERFLWIYIPRHAPKAKPSDRVLGEMDVLLVRLETVARDHFCYRDFQPRNIMWREGPVFLDYQSGRRGALQYDLASLLYSPDSGLQERERMPLIDAYLKSLAECGVKLEKFAFLADFHPFVLVRRLQALGAYAQLGKQPGREHFRAKIAPALADLGQLLESGKLSMGLPALEAWLRTLVRAGAGG